MLSTFYAIIGIGAAIVLWAVSIKRKLAELDENSRHAMYQIGVQLSSRFDALTVLLDLTRSYTRQESDGLTEAMHTERRVITANSTPADVLHQEGIIAEALAWIAMVTQESPELKVHQDYITTMDAVAIFDNMVHTSQLIYNDCVTKLNREVRRFPVVMIAGIMGFRQRDYLEEPSAQADLPHMK